jgi:hypothetical protein
MIIAFAIIAFLGLMVASELADKNKKHKALKLSATEDASAGLSGQRNYQQPSNGYGGHYPPPYYQQGPIFSPDKRYIWDAQNQRWIPNNGGMWIGLFIGLAIGIGIALLMYFA